MANLIRVEHPYNPLAKENLGKSVADALLERALGPLPPPDRFIAAGVYTIYYDGPFKAYAPLIEHNQAKARIALSPHDQHQNSPLFSTSIISACPFRAG